MARTEVLATMKRIRRQLHSGHRSEVNTLGGPLDASTTEVIFGFDPGASVIVGAVLGVDLELMRVVARVDNTVTVIRGWQDSTAAAHLAGVEVQINPRWSMLDIYEAMIAEINSWGPQLYRVHSDELTVGWNTEAVELPVEFAGMYGVCAVRRKFDTDTTKWPAIETRLVRAPTWSGAPTSGLLLRFVDPMSGGQVLVTAAMPITTDGPALDDDLVDDVHVPSSLLDVLEMGAKLRIANDAEFARLSRQSQDDSRRNEEVPVGAPMQPLQYATAVYRNRKQEEINKLRALYPIRMS